MAEAVRPTRKKRKAKKRSAEANDGLEYVQKDVQETEKDTWASVKEQETVLEVTSDDLNQKKEDGASAESTGGQAVDVNTKDNFLERDNGSSKERTLENILHSTEKENVGIKSNEGQAGSEKMDIKNKNSTEETNLVENKEVEDTEEQLGTIGLQEDIEGHVSTSKVEQGITNEDTELYDEQLGTKGATEDIVESKEETKTDLVGDINDTEGIEGQQGTIEDSFTENVDLVTIRDTEDIEDHSGTIQGTHEELMEQMTYAAPTCMDEASSSAVVSGAIVQESRDLNISVLSEERQSSTGVLTQEKNLYGHIYNLFGKQQVSSRARETVTAFTEDDLKSFYYNPALTYVEDYVDEFIKDTLEPQRESEFYELLNTYQNTSKNLRNVQSDIEILKKKCKEQKKTVWSTETKTVTVQGTCKDQQKVTFTRSYEVASFNMEQAAKISRTLDSIKNTIHETFTLAKYSCQLARVHITSYIYELHAQSPVFCGISQESPVIGNDPSQVSHVVFGEIQHLRDCISALFAFLRRPTVDKGFYEDVDSWLQNLVALLLRVATLHDHIFLLNHVLRCPPGVTRKLAHFIQPLLFPTWATDLSNDEYIWHNPLLHHFVTTLATLLLPIKFREKYLLKMKALLTPDGSESSKSLSWVIVDEDGEEDENPEESWMLIPENDLVALFLQFPFDGLFKLIIGRDCFDGSEVVDSEAHVISRKTTTNVMQVFAFSTCLIEMLGKAFSLYSMRRYREFVKRLGRAIRTIVMHVSRYWSVYKNHYISKYGDNETTFHLAFGSEYSLEKLQLEYDQFFIRASQQIFSAHKLGAWQFLIDMPFQSLSSKMTWTCYRFLHQGIMDKDTFVSLSEYVSSHSDHLDVNDTTALVDCFKLMTESEVVFLLTTFANMARARSTEDCDFITAVVREIYEVSYIDDKAPDFLPKTGKDLLGSICSSHPFVMSLLLERIEETLEKVREECVPLFQTLPVETWRPKLRDIQTIRNWLLRSVVDSSEHQLSRYLLTNLNWQYQDLESDVLYLPRSVHRAVAILLVETCALRLSNRPGGIAVDVFKETPGIIEQVTQLATAPYQRIVQHYSDQDLYKWLWEVIMFLHLHEAECPASVMHFTNTSSSTPQDEGITSSYDRSEFFRTLSKSEPLDLDTDEVLVNVLTSANKDGPLACYAALQLSSYGHDPIHLCGSGLGYISVILEEGHVFATCRIIENVLPTFFTRDMLEFSETSRISKIIDTIIHSDTRWRDQDVLEIMSGIIQKHVKGSSVVPGTNRTLIALEFWLRTLCYLPNWNTDTKVLHLLNHLLKCVFRNSDAHQIVVDYFVKKHEDSLKSLKDQGFLSSLISFLTSNPSQANLVDINAMSSYAYHCYYVLCAESIYQDQGGLKLALANKLHDKPDMCVETALKKVSSSIKDIVLIPSCNLDIYRWADLALSLDHDQPLLAIVWQKFFQQFLCRVPAGPGMPERGSVGLRFFESTVNTTYLKRLKARLMGTVEHHKALSTARSEPNNEDTKYKTPLELHSKLAKLFQTLALWLDEPRIHDPTLFLKGLPPVYDSERLSNILNSHQNVWLECVDIGKIDWELNESVQSWMKFNRKRQKKISAIQNRLMMKKIDRMSSKMTSLDDVVMPPSFQILSAPLPEFPISVLLDKQKIMETLSDNLHVLAEHARKFSMKFSVNSALDFEYVDMLQHLYENPETQLRVSVPCQKKVCHGAAAIVVKFREKKSIDLVRQGAAQNREKYENLIHEMLHEMPVDICTNALCVEKCLTLLLKQWKSCQNPALVKKFEMIGSSIFYMFIDMVSDGVRRFPPTMQFFSTCVELLGKAFIMENQEQTETLLRTILAHANIVGLLLPIFQPSTCQGNFAEMFENIIQTSLDVEVKFSLLSKFDFRRWLAPKPTLTERITMMKVLFAALCDCGFEPPVKTTMLSEIYLRKINLVLLYHFPDLFGETLKLLIDGSADQALCVNSWNEFLLTTKILIKNTTKRELELNTSPPFLLEHEQITETMAWLVEYYNDQRSSCSSSTTIEGLFTMWKPYLMLLTALYEYLSRQSIAARAQELSQNDGHVIRSLWKAICDLFSPWIFPCQLNSQSVYPWSEMEVVQASEFVELYTRVLIYFQNFLSEVSSVGHPNVLSLLWQLYSSIVIKEVPPVCVLRVYHAKFTLMPWEAFCPTVSHLETMLQICNDHGNCRSFVGCIFPKIPWLHALQSLRSLGDMDVLGQFQACLFNLFLVLANEKSIIKVEASEMITLLKAAEKFDWDLIDANTFSTCCNWLISNCDFVQILEPSSTVWCSLRLLQAACLLSDPVPSSHTYIEISEKRLHYLNCMVKLLCKCSSGPQHSPGLFRPVIEQLMDNVLAAANSGETINSQNITAQYMEILNLLNQLSPREKVLGLALETVQEKIRDLNGRTMILAMIVAGCRSLASIFLMVQIIEVAVETHFNNITPVVNNEVKPEESLVSPWSDILSTLTVPELSQREFVQECINHNAVLTLFAHVVQCLSQCPSAAQELSMLKDLTKWTASIKPLSPDSETKVILLWYKILQLVVRQVKQDVNLRDLGVLIDFIIPLITHAGEDRDTSGLLGVIGLGRKSPLTVNFRFLCRALSTFLSAQLPSNGIPRVNANSPGAVKDVAKKDVSSSSGVVHASQRTSTAFHNLEGLRVNKTYSSLLEYVEFACKFIINPVHSLCDGPEFLKTLTNVLFKGKTYLQLVV